MNEVPREWQAPSWPDGLTDAQYGGQLITRAQAEGALARYVATRLIASWVAYQGQGLRSVLASLVSAYALAALALAENGDGHPTIGRLTSALRAADWLLLHLLDRQQWATWCSQWEASADARALLAMAAAAHRLLDGLPWGEAPDPPEQVSASSGA